MLCFELPKICLLKIGNWIDWISNLVWKLLNRPRCFVVGLIRKRKQRKFHVGLVGWLSRYNKISQWGQNKWVGEYTDHDILPALWLWLRTTIQSTMPNLMKIKMLSILFKNHAVWSNIQMGLLPTGCSRWGLGKSWDNLNYFIKWKIRNTNFRNLNAHVFQHKKEGVTAWKHNKVQLFRIHSIQMEHLVVVSTTNIIPLPYLR